MTGIVVGFDGSPRGSVVGSRGRGGFAGLVLGSVSQSVAHAGGSPLVIVRSAG
jgi:nucleotide-binding universal stress UspA family protein